MSSEQPAVSTRTRLKPQASSHSHQFDSASQQRLASYAGMWVFLDSEVMFLGALIAAYIVYRFSYPAAFKEASQHLYWALGGVNTAVLLCSSLTMALAVRAAQLGKRSHLIIFLGLTMLLGLTFLGIKATEYYLEYQEHLVPLKGFDFRFAGTDPDRAQLFFHFYFGLTGLHALHLIIGVGLVGAMMVLGWRNHFSPDYSTPVEVVGLFWHFVDIVWVFLYPLLYLIG